MANQADGGAGTCYSYDADGNLTSFADGSGTTTYSYNAADLLTGVTESNGHTDTFCYNADHKRVQSWFGTSGANATAAGCSFDANAPTDTVTAAPASSAVHTVANAG